MEGLRSHEEDSSLFVVVFSVLLTHQSRQFGYFTLGNLRNSFDEALSLLIDQWFGWCQKEDLTILEPAMEVKHHRRGNESFAETGGQSDQGVLEKGRSDNLELVSPEGFRGGVDPSFERQLASFRLYYIVVTRFWIRSGIERNAILFVEEILQILGFVVRLDMSNALPGFWFVAKYFLKTLIEHLARWLARKFHLKI